MKKPDFIGFFYFFARACARKIFMFSKKNFFGFLQIRE